MMFYYITALVPLILSPAGVVILLNEQNPSFSTASVLLVVVAGALQWVHVRDMTLIKRYEGANPRYKYTYTYWVIG